jgi:hypothetical protein
MKLLPRGSRLWRIVFLAAGAALALAIPIACFRWLVYPHVKLTVFNETSTAIRDVCVKCDFTKRTAERIEPGGLAVTDIQAGGESMVYISYRNPRGVLKVDEPVYYSGSSGSYDRGFLEVHVTNEDRNKTTGEYMDSGWLVVELLDRFYLKPRSVFWLLEAIDVTPEVLTRLSIRSPAWQEPVCGDTRITVLESPRIPPIK